MNTELSTEDINIYASDAQTIQQPQGTDYTQGAQVGRSISAKWWNWLYNKATEIIHEIFSDDTAVYSELSNTVVDTGLQLRAEDSTQLSQALHIKARNSVPKFLSEHKAEPYAEQRISQQQFKCSGLYSGTFGINDILSYSVADNKALAIIFINSTIYMAYSTDLANWKITKAIADTLLAGDVTIAAGVVCLQGRYAASVFYYNTKDYTGLFTWHVHEEFYLSIDGENWSQKISEQADYVNVPRPGDVCYPVLTVNSEQNNIVYLSPLIGVVYRYSTILLDTYFLTQNGYAVHQTLSDLNQQQVADRVQCRINLAQHTVPYVQGNDKGVHVGNLIIHGTQSAYVEALTQVMPAGATAIYQLDSGDYLCSVCEVHANALIDTTVKSTIYLYKVAASDGTVISLGAHTLGGAGVNAVVHVPQAEAYVFKVAAQDHTRVSIDFSVDGSTYYRLPFEVPIVGSRVYTTDSVPVVYDSGNYYILSADCNLYSIAGHLSASIEDYTLVTQLPHIYTPISLTATGISGVWNVVANAEKCIIADFGRRVLPYYDDASVIIPNYLWLKAIVTGMGHTMPNARGATLFPESSNRVSQYTLYTV